jgi:pectin methylesterase-like acyl-CoA thioesterase
MLHLQGSYYYYGEQRLGQGRDGVSAMLAGDAILTQQLTGEVKAAIQAAVDAAAADPHIKNVYIGAGTYTFTATVTVPQGITITGSGYNTQLVGTGAFPAFTLTTGNQTISGIRFNTFSFSLTGPATDVFAYGNWLTAAPIGTVTGSIADNL